VILENPCVVTGDFGKPRPALIIQSDLFSKHPTVTVLPLTSHLELENAPYIRIQIEPTPANGLRKTSQIMIDKTVTVRREKIGSVIGHISEEALFTVHRALMVFFGLS